MDESNSFRFECIRCGNCCTDEKTIVNTTYFDILRIKDGLNLTLDELLYILGFYKFKDDITQKEQEKMVISAIKTEKGLAFVGLYKKKNGDCYFYDSNSKKCTIYSVRPMFCRTFPFSFRKDKTHEQKVNIGYSNKGLEYCPGIGNKSPSININDWLALGKRTLSNIEKNEKIIESYNSSVNHGKIKPTTKNFIQFLLNSVSV